MEVHILGAATGEAKGLSPAPPAAQWRQWGCEWVGCVLSGLSVGQENGAFLAYACCISASRASICRYACNGWCWMGWRLGLCHQGSCSRHPSLGQGPAWGSAWGLGLTQAHPPHLCTRCCPLWRAREALLIRLRLGREALAARRVSRSSTVPEQQRLCGCQPPPTGATSRVPAAAWAVW